MELPSAFLRFRNRLLSDPKFLAFAQRFPLMRSVARRRSRALFDLLAGFSYSQVLYACVSLRLIERVGLDGVNFQELCSAAGLPGNKAEILIRAAIALDILQRDKDSIVLGPHGAALLGQPWIMRFVEHHRYFYRDLEDPIAMLQGKHAPDGLQSYWGYDDPAADKSAYSALMAASQQAVSQQVLRAYDFGRHNRLLDVGGGTGAFLNAAGERHPALELHLFDLPGVAALAGASMASRVVRRHCGDFRHDELPKGADIITILRVVHDHDDDVVLRLLRNVRSACLQDTVVLIAEPFAGFAATAPVTDAYFNLYFAAMGQGRTRTPAEIAALAAQAGFGNLRVWRTDMPLITGVMTLRPQA